MDEDWLRGYILQHHTAGEENLWLLLDVATAAYQYGHERGYQQCRDDETLYTVRELAARWKIRPEAVRRMIRADTLEATLAIGGQNGYRIRGDVVARKEAVRYARLTRRKAREAEAEHARLVASSWLDH